MTAASDNEQYVELELTPELHSIFMEIKDLFSVYISSYVHVLNKFIGILRKISTLRFERSTLIKYVKKLRFYNDRLSNFEFSDPANAECSVPVESVVREISAFYLKVLETIDILNYYLTRSLQSEIVSKTLNFNLTLPDDTISRIEESYNCFIKFVQWMMESISINDELLQIEIIQFSLKCAIEDNVDLEETDNIFLTEVTPVEDIEEYETLALQWSEVLSGSISALTNQFDQSVVVWIENSEKKANK
ncbi:hypothetical protein TPHA_0G02873 [Tetrapisispora phaffii CBS 4417]|uniref:RNA binding protein She2 domain-containing protein n=1 Tax=Tetrapisispora phaffii (strain ATCC 24235 / CBS 4417 / NBRC 1672 / NRRL Y-8282 / UCD 70-5) TaxID=1071381 RepID=G8BW48_TETPH|nr:hypothetical protein TPHA_0G02873 [Tetrapisispora phaffii CBS 4417]CCE64126.1 hypothetical protein TPHA_0G02873 [Tetrapisispora phaffii CBS 4417]